MTPASNVVQNAADFGSFNASVSSVYNLPPDMSASAAGSQQSQILDSSIIASGSGGGGQHGQYFQGTSYFSVTFTLGSDSAFTLGGNIADPAYESGLQFSLYTQLTGPNGQIFQTPLDYRVFGGGYTYSTNGVLAAGQYVLTSEATVTAYRGSSAHYNLELDVTPIPEPSAIVMTGLGLFLICAGCVSCRYPCG